MRGWGHDRGPLGVLGMDRRRMPPSPSGILGNQVFRVEKPIRGHQTVAKVRPETILKELKANIVTLTDLQDYRQNFSHQDKADNSKARLPISPLLFALNTQPLMLLLREEEKKGNLTGLSIPRGKPLLHRLFADDSGITLAASELNFRNLRATIMKFERISGAMLHDELRRRCLMLQTPFKIRHSFLDTIDEGLRGKKENGALLAILAAHIRAVWTDRNAMAFQNRSRMTPLVIILNHAREEIEGSFTNKSRDANWLRGISALQVLNQLIHYITQRSPAADDPILALRLSNQDEDFQARTIRLHTLDAATSFQSPLLVDNSQIKDYTETLTTDTSPRLTCSSRHTENTADKLTTLVAAIHLHSPDAEDNS
ncbi:hypothetical protein R1sor_019201 [Riccia sorocarpa]|uniref:Reverse transcriptase domain-containing protein n=1 Tax=Riccia sorocarpa TaxID=122646 RepID=A0ABD3II20_9MARC